MNVTTFINRPLPKHCESLGIPLEVVTLKHDESGWWVGDMAFKRPEPAILQIYKNESWHGTYVEGSPVIMTIKCAAFDWLVKHNLFQTRLDAIRDAPMGAIMRHPDKVEEFLAEIQACSERLFLKNFIEIYADDIVKSLHPYLNPPHMAALFRALGPKLTQIARIWATRPYDLRVGWPDLCLVKESEVQFVEVKTTDNIHQSQHDVITTVLNPLNLSMKVVKVVKQC